MSILSMFGLHAQAVDPEKNPMLEEILARRKRSEEWLASNFYPEWEEVYQNYKLYKQPYKNDRGEEDLDRYSMALPDTLITTQRLVARVTAQIPQISYRAEDPEVARAVSRTLMWQWDKSQMQRVHRRGVLQAALFGWSVTGFEWEIEEYIRRRRIELFQELSPLDRMEIAQQYEIDAAMLDDPTVHAALAAKYGRGSKSVPIDRPYRAYVGPRPYFCFIGDCFPEPNFESIQSSSWFIVERRRNRDRLDDMARRFPEFREGIARLYQKFPNGSDPDSRSRAQSPAQDFRNRLRHAISKMNGTSDLTRTDDATWALVFEHKPGKHGRLRVIGEDAVAIGEIPYPLSLDGKIAFAETEYIPELFGGIGDSTPRLIRPLQSARNQSFERRMNLVSRIERPLVVTSDKKIYANPNLVQRGPGFRLIFSETGVPLQYASDQAAAASVIASMGQDSDLSRNIQMATGESNLTLMAGVDAQQARTATGSRLMQQNMDVLSRSYIRSIADSGIAGAVEIMFLMNASELTDAVRFDAVKYDDRFGYKSKSAFIEAKPYIFQGEGTLTISEGSTLADDDEASLTKAQTLWGVAMQRPDIVNPRKAAEIVLEAMGERPRLQEWILPEQPPAPPEAPKRSLSLSFKGDDLDPNVRMAVLADAGLIRPPEPTMPQPPLSMPDQMDPGMPDIPPEIMAELLQQQSLPPQ